MMGMVVEQALKLPLYPESIRLKHAKRQITRNRTSYSCQTCRRRKIKCDKQHPTCGSCTRNNEQCVYGKLQRPTEDPAKGVGHVGTKRRLTPVSNGPSSPHSTPSDSVSQAANFANLDALEQQLNRLGAMIETARQRSGAMPRFAAPLTPSSAADGWYAPHGSGGQPVIDGNSSLTKPLSELYISTGGQSPTTLREVPFWSSMADEVEQLHAMMQNIRPLDPPPDAETQFMPAPDPQDPSLQQKPPEKQQKHPNLLSFHSMAGRRTDSIPTADCHTCQSLTVEKAMLLPGPHATRLASGLKLNLAAGTPTEAQSNVLFRVWLSSVYSAMPFAPLRRAFSQYTEYWAWRQACALGYSTDTPDVYFMPVLYAIWYTATLALSSAGFKNWFPDRSRADLAAEYHDQIIRFLSLVSFPTNAQCPLIGCLIVLLAVPAAEEEPLESSIYVNLLVKLAQNAGIHREPSLFALDAYEAEIRRRLWWEVVKLDVAFASSSGFPVNITDDMADVRPITDVYERYIGTQEEKNYVEKASEEGHSFKIAEPLSTTDSIISVSSLFTRMSHKIAVTTRNALNMHMSAKVINKQMLQQTNKMIATTHDEVMEAIRSIPTKGLPELGFNPDVHGLSQWPVLECDPCLGESLTTAEFAYYHGLSSQPLPSKLTQYHRQKMCVFNKWTRITLSLLLDQMHCTTYAPFLKNAKSKVWVTGRQCALHHATSFLRKFISLATEPAFQSFMYLWPGGSHPTHAAIILLVDVHERPRAVEAPRSRVLIDRLFSLSDPESGIVGGSNGVSSKRPLHEGGTEAWDLLRDLRNWGWRKAGLDPNVLWTEEDQIAVGVAKPLSSEQRMLQILREDAFEPETNAGTDHDVATTGETDPALQYAIETVVGGMKGQEVLNPAEVGPDPRWKHRELLRLPTQRLMPYPLSGLEKHTCQTYQQAQAQQATENDYAEADVQRVEEMLKRAKEKHEAQARSAMEARQMKASGGNAYASTNGHSGDVIDRLKSTPADSTQHEAISGGSDLIQADSNGPGEDSDMSESFDWERWDQVFGQYSGFTDLMEMDDLGWGEADEGQHGQG